MNKFESEKKELKINCHLSLKTQTSKIAYIIHFLLGAENLLYHWKGMFSCLHEFYSSNSSCSREFGWFDQESNLRFQNEHRILLVHYFINGSSIIDRAGRPKGAYSLTVASVVVYGLADPPNSARSTNQCSLLFYSHHYHIVVLQLVQIISHGTA